MSTVHEIEEAIAHLKPAEIEQVAKWINSHPTIAKNQRLQRLRAAKGIWKDRQDIPNVRTLREEFERF